MTTDRSPVIRDDGWGFVDVEGLGPLRDAKLWPGGGRAWDWSETGTHHRPGVQPADLADVLAHDPAVVVLSRGRELRLEVTPEVLILLTDRNIEVVRAETAAAIAEYNRRAGAGERVAALLHSTC